MYRKLTGSIIVLLALAACAPAQPLPKDLKTGYEELDAKLAKMVTVDDNAISAKAANGLADALFLDAREPDEYAVSHLPGAKLLGYSEIDWSQLRGVDKSRPVVVYCTVGYRSERVARDLRERGFERVYNLYGSLYAWALAGLPLEGPDGQRTRRIHTYNKRWGTFIPDTVGEKTY